MMDQYSGTKKKILEVALNLFSKNGYDRTSIRQIARKVGIRESAIYNHFKGKKEILSILFDVYSGRRICDHIEEMINHEDIIDAPYLFLQSVVTEEIIKYICNEDTIRFRKIVVMEMFSVKDAREIIEKELITDVRKQIADVFEVMMKAGVIKPFDSALLANEFLAPLIFLSLEHLIKSSEEDDIEYYRKRVQSHIDFFWEAVKAE